jgi:hypothetical protein
VRLKTRGERERIEREREGEVEREVDTEKDAKESFTTHSFGD